MKYWLKITSGCYKVCFDIIKHSTDVLNRLSENLTLFSFHTYHHLSGKTMKRQSSKIYKNQIHLKVHHYTRRQQKYCMFLALVQNNLKEEILAWKKRWKENSQEKSPITKQSRRRE